MSFQDAMSLLNVLLLPLTWHVIQTERRITALETKVGMLLPKPTK